MPTELNERGHIPGIYNYCDRWCEKCRFQLKCRLYADLSDDNGNLVEHESMEEVLEKVHENFQKTFEMLHEMADEHGIDLEEAANDPDVNEQVRKEEELVEVHALGPLTWDYGSAARVWAEEHRGDIIEWIESLNKQITLDISIEDLSQQAHRMAYALEAVSYYMFQIHVKTKRALHGLYDENDDWDDDIQTDANGSARVALVGVDRSIECFQTIGELRPDLAADVMPMIGQLQKIRQVIETQFPNAQRFVRPGFDTGD